MHNISSQWLWKMESTSFVQSWVDVILNFTSFNASRRRSKFLSLSFSSLNHSELKKPIGKSSELIVETRQMRKTPSSMPKNLLVLASSRSKNVISKLCPLLRQYNWCLWILFSVYPSFAAPWRSYELWDCIKWFANSWLFAGFDQMFWRNNCCLHLIVLYHVRQ